ncbi:hypothetical protein BPNPMPFG_002532 [Mesorhizobium sp. AR07]|uniref:hypothetical protein n=1 Tax=Mesorhizobium sp. AR07 TaxID=2865838 RepID=UPI0021606877|nr:hypothetical protein [Mesorhizobium sp. AR07]UVK46822.1 hypothetical protein BPNPMPFG_002532 [Mesorhizobium sp. AR07]
MAGWREQKRKARGDIHRTFEIPAVYLTHAAGVAVRANVRLHLKQVLSKVQSRDWLPTASLQDETNRIIFQTIEVAEVLSKAYVILGASEAYRTGTTEPEVDGYIQVEVAEVPAAELAALLAATNTTGPAWEGILA